MAERIKSGIKRHRQSLKKRDRNTVVKSDLKTQLKKFESVLESKDPSSAQQILRETEAKLRKAASKGLIKKETASRKVSRISKRVAALSS
ncbi:MAG: 30S ribosomal protein S20 [Thermodesulfobacteriales bacterium]|jgi:small subunit ribosomal protein S20|nr:MAG: 30S ribosomal protein S20 [Thermodesulfobacteriales bacterium]